MRCYGAHCSLFDLLEPRFWIAVAVGTTIADRPPRRSVRARLRIRLLLWMNGGETCCWPHTVQSLGHALPALCRTHVGWNDVLLSLCPSLPGLRRRHAALRCSAGSLVLRHRPTSPVRSCPPCGLWPSRTGLGRLTKTCRRSPGSRACCFSACAGSQTTQDRANHSQFNVVAVLPSSSRNGVGILFHRLFEAQ
jgi:hypothetical protein